MSPSDALDLLTNDEVALELLASDVAMHLAYTGNDGLPRSVPIAWVWDGRHVIVATPTNAPKLKALRASPNVALSFNLGTAPDRVLLVRGTIDIEVVQGVPQVFIDANAKLLPADAMDEFTAGVQELYPEMAIISITPTWAKALDFIERVPDAIAK